MRPVFAGRSFINEQSHLQGLSPASIYQTALIKLCTIRYSRIVVLSRLGTGEFISYTSSKKILFYWHKIESFTG